MKFFDTEKMNLSLKKLEYYKNEELGILNSIRYSLERVNSCFQTNNQDNLVEIENILSDKMNVMKNVHNNNIKVLNRRIKEQEELTRENIQILSNIGGQDK